MGEASERILLSVIVASYETRDLLRACLASLGRATEGLSAEILAVDNCSLDGSAAMVEAEFPGVVLMRNTRNEGFAKANNRALKASRGARVLFLNPDTEVSGQGLRTLLGFLDQHEEVGMVGPKLVREDGSLDEACKRGIPTLSAAFFRLTGLDRVFPKSRWAGAYRQTFRDADGRHEVDSIVGAFMLVKREALAVVGGLDEAYFMFGEDLDFCLRMKHERFKVWYLGDVVVLHHKNASVRKAPHRMNWHFHRSMVVFHNKHFGQRYPFFVNWAVYVGIGLRYALKGLAMVSRSCLRGVRWGGAAKAPRG